MRNVEAIRAFSSSPRLSLVLAALQIVIGLVMVLGLVPASTTRRYIPGHEWILAAMAWLLALFFGFCAVKGLRSKGRDVSR